MNRPVTDMSLIAGGALDERFATDDTTDPSVDWQAVVRLGITMSTTAAAAAVVTHASLGPVGQGMLVLTVIGVGFTGSLLRTLRD
jgi:hypothetical protein